MFDIRSIRSLYRLLITNGLINVIQKYHKDSKHSKYVQLTSFPTHCFPNYRIYSIRPFPKKKLNTIKKKKRKKRAKHSRNDRNLNFTRERDRVSKNQSLWITCHSPLFAHCSLVQKLQAIRKFLSKLSQANMTGRFSIAVPSLRQR